MTVPVAIRSDASGAWQAECFAPRCGWKGPRRDSGAAALRQVQAAEDADDHQGSHEKKATVRAGWRTVGEEES